MAEQKLDTYEPEFKNITGPSILIITADDTEDLEFFYPYYRFIEAGCNVDVATPDGGEFHGKNKIGLQNSKKIEDISASGYQLLYIPGGKAPEELKKNEHVLSIVRQFVSSGRPIAAICHGPQVLAAAGVLQGHRVSAWPGVQSEVEQAGAIYVAQECLKDGPFITGRWPGDLPAFTKKVLELINVQTSAGSKVAA